MPQEEITILNLDKTALKYAASFILRVILFLKYWENLIENSRWTNKIPVVLLNTISYPWCSDYSFLSSLSKNNQGVYIYVQLQYCWFKNPKNEKDTFFSG